ncbi:hypothetical protein [Microbacterium sp. 179-I 3D4 NHS]|uniref:hypothetical protein n=1 Tax=Microbacterium sp. 179-I 3D4 NHS TaxID=3142381 RepID=UPI0039A35448
MGLFQQRPEEEEKQWAGLPSEPRERDGVADLDTAAPVDPLTLGFGAATSSIVFPVAPPPPAASSVEDSEPEPERDPGPDTELETD